MTLSVFVHGWECERGIGIFFFLFFLARIACWVRFSCGDVMCVRLRSSNMPEFELILWVGAVMKWDMILLSEKASFYCYNAMVTAKEGQVRMQYSHRCKDSKMATWHHF